MLSRQKNISWSLFLTICSPGAYMNHRRGLWDGMATDEDYLVGWTVELRLIWYRYRSPDPDLIPSHNIGLMSPIHAPIWCFYIRLVLTTVVLVAEDVNAKSALWWDNWTDSYRYQIYQCGSHVRTYSLSCVSLSFTVSFWEPSLLSSAAACLCVSWQESRQTWSRGEGHWCYSSWWQGGLLRSSVALVCLSGKLNMLDKVGYTPNSSSAGSLFLQKGFVWVREMMCTNQVHFWIKRKIVFMFSCNT